MQRARRGVTLAEILIVLALIGVFMTIVVVGFYGTSSARLRRGATVVAGSIRVAYTHATASSKVVRLVFDLGTGVIALEETRDRHLLKRDPFGGDAANEAEEDAFAAADAASVRTPPSSFTSLNLRKMSGMKWDRKEQRAEEDEPVTLPDGIQFWQVDVEHQDAPVSEGKAYLYFFPGGQTENTSIQLRVANSDDDKTGFMTVIVSPLTGKASIHAGRLDAPKPQSELEASEVEDPGR